MPRSASTVSIDSGAGWAVTGPVLPVRPDRCKGQQFLDEAVHVMTVGEGVMDVKRGMRLSVADGQPEVHQRLALVEMRWGAFECRARRPPPLRFPSAAGHRRRVVAAVGAPLQTRGAKDRVRLEQKIEGVRQRVDIDRTLEVCGKAHEVVRLGEHFLAVVPASE